MSRDTSLREPIRIFHAHASRAWQIGQSEISGRPPGYPPDTRTSRCTHLPPSNAVAAPRLLRRSLHQTNPPVDLTEPFPKRSDVPGLRRRAIPPRAYRIKPFKSRTPLS